MSSDPIERLRHLVQVADPDGMVTVRWLAGVLGVRLEDGEPTEEGPLRDLSVEEVAAAMGRSPSTVRGWLIAGALRGYKLNGRDWRVTRAALEEYRAKQGAATPPPSEDPVDVSAWRRAG